MKKLPWRSMFASLEHSWKSVQEPTLEQVKKFCEIDKSQQDWFRVTYALYPEIKKVVVELDKHNTEVRNELNAVYKGLKGLDKIFKHVNRRV